MSRRWSMVLTAYPLIVVGLIYAMSLVPAFHQTLVAVRYVDGNPIAMGARIGSFFVPLSSDDMLADAMHPWAWLPRLVFVGSLAVLVYLAGRALTESMGCGRVALLLAGVTMLAGGLADVTGLAIATWRFASLFYQDRGLSTALGLSLSQMDSYWMSDALFLGLWLGGQVGLVVVVVCFLRRLRLTGKDNAVPTADAYEPRIGKIPGQATKLAVLGVIPVLSAAFVGGADRFNPDAVRTSLLDVVLADQVFYLKLRSTPPSRGDFDQAVGVGVVGPEKWLSSAAIAIIFVGVLWLTLQFVIAGLGSPGKVAGVTVAVTAWGLTVLVGAFVGIVDAVARSVTAQILDPGAGDQFWYDLQVTLVNGMSFGVQWGWLVGLLVVLGYRRTRIPDVVPA